MNMITNIDRSLAFKIAHRVNQLSAPIDNPLNASVLRTSTTDHVTDPRSVHYVTVSNSFVTSVHIVHTNRFDDIVYSTIVFADADLSR